LVSAHQTYQLLLTFQKIRNKKATVETVAALNGKKNENANIPTIPGIPDNSVADHWFGFLTLLF
jgi:hypothetical protein